MGEAYDVRLFTRPSLGYSFANDRGRLGGRLHQSEASGSGSPNCDRPH